MITPRPTGCELFLAAPRAGVGMLAILIAIISAPVAAQDVAPVPREGWVMVADFTPAVRAAEPWVRPDVFQPVILQLDAMRQTLAAAPMEFAGEARQAALELALPMPDGSIARFLVVESPVMAPELAAQYPEIKTYLGWGIDDPAASLRCDVTPAGFHAQILSPHGAVYIDPYSRGDVEHYASYYKRDLVGRGDFECLFAAEDGHVHEPPPGIAAVMSGETLRTYRLAVAATGEYTQFHGGTVAAGLAAIVTAVNRVTGIYEVDVAVRMVLVANNNLIVYTNGGTDPYSNGSGVTMLGQNQSNLDAVIGNANYDIGHVFSTGGGGVASLGVVCVGGSKARGVTGQGAPIGDPFYVDYVAHEMGHQFRGNHSFNGTNGSCSGGNRNGATAYEPGSGSTIMAYAGICGADNLQANSDPYFHSINYDEIIAFVSTGTGSTCAQTSATGNNAPTVNAGLNYNIPRLTPFELTAVGTDPDNDPLTYCWEQRDLGAAQALSAPDNGTSPLFRSFNPTSSPTRVFPRLTNILNNINHNSEKLPNTNRTLRYRVIARDNRAGGGGAASGNMQLSVTTSAGPFLVTSPNTAVTWGGTQTVTWDVANTNNAPVNASHVDILLSTDGGFTFPTVLAANTPNDGSELVGLPAINTTTARIKIKAVNNVFFDISNTNFTIDPAGAVSPPFPAPSFPHNELKNRYISFAPNNLTPVALRVHLASGPGAPLDVGWVDEPVELGCPSSCSGEFIARVTDTMVVRVWPEPLLHVGDCPMVPGASYEVSATVDGVLFSPALTVATTPKPLPKDWGDTVGEFSFVFWTGPNGISNFNDVSAIIQKFQGDSTAPHFTWVDLHAESPNTVINFSDVQTAIQAFQGMPYPYPAPGDCP